MTLPPATTGTGAVTPPENTSCPALQPLALGGELVGQPGHRRRRVAHHGRTGRRHHDLTVDPHDAADQPQILQLAGPAGDRAQVEGAGTGVVGHHVGQGELEALVARVEHVDRAEDDVGGGQHRGHGGRRLDVAGQQERDLGLHPRVDEAVQPDRIAVAADHAAGHPAVQRRVHAHRLLLVAAGQPQLVADETLTGVELGLHERPLRPVGGVQVEIGIVVAELRDRLALALGDDQLRRRCPEDRSPYASRNARRMRVASSKSRRTCGPTQGLNGRIPFSGRRWGQSARDQTA